MISPWQFRTDWSVSAVATTDADENETQLDYVFEDMRMREREDRPETSRSARDGGQANESDNRANGSDEVRMLEDGTLGRTPSRGARRVSYVMQATSSLDGVRLSVVARGRVRTRHRQKAPPSFADAFDLG